MYPACRTSFYINLRLTVNGGLAGSEAGAWLSRPSRRRERPLGAALNPYRKFSLEAVTQAVTQGVWLRLMCGTVASLDARHFRPSSSSVAGSRSGR